MALNDEAKDTSRTHRTRRTPWPVPLKGKSRAKTGVTVGTVTLPTVKVARETTIKRTATLTLDSEEKIAEVLCAALDLPVESTTVTFDIGQNNLRSVVLRTTIEEKREE